MNHQLKPLISILLPVHNGQKFLASSIESILNQKFKNFELIILNDCSTDASLTIINSYATSDSRIRVHSNTTNLKLPKTLNIGHKMSRGEYITWTSDDNLLKENFLQVLLKNIINTKCDLVYANFDTIDSKGKITGQVSSKDPPNIIYGSVVGAAFLYTREVFNRSRGYDESLFMLEDYDFWLRSSLHSKFCRIPDNIYQYRKHNKSLSSKIQGDLATRNTFRKGLLQCFTNIGKNLNWHIDSAYFFMQMHLNSTDSLQLFLNNHKTIVRDLENFSKAMGASGFKDNLSLWEKLRGFWFHSEVHLNYKTLMTLSTYYPSILFHKRLSKKNSLKLITKCLF